MSDYIQIARNRGHSYIQLASIRGTPNRTNNPIPMILDDFYTLCMKNPNENLGLRKQIKQDHLPTFKSSDIDINYLCSDFVRFCLSLYKNKGTLDRGELKIIPKQPIPISEELKNYIEEFLPDFHGIRK